MSYNRALKFVFIFSFSLIALYNFLLISLPIIVDYFWPIVSTPTAIPHVRSLKIVHKLQRNLYTLENELLILNSKQQSSIHNFENYWDPKLSAIELKIREVNEYSRKLGPLVSAEKARVVVTCIETVKLLDGISKNFDQVKDEAFGQLSVYATKVKDLLQLWPTWELYKHLEYLAEINIILDKHQKKSHITTDNNSLKESIILMKTLLQHFESSEEVTQDILRILIAKQALPNSAKFLEKNQSGNIIPAKIDELQDIKSDVVRYYNENLYKFGRVYMEILEATKRIPKLFEKRMENARNHWSSLANQLRVKMIGIGKLQTEIAKNFNFNDNTEKAQGMNAQEIHEEL